MQSFRFYNTIKLLHFSKALYKKNNTLGKSQIFNFGLAATQLLKHTNTSVKGKHKHHSSSTSRNTLGQNTRVKRYKLSTLLHFLFLFFFLQGWAIHRTPSTIYSTILLLQIQYDELLDAHGTPSE